MVAQLSKANNAEWLLRRIKMKAMMRKVEEKKVRVDVLMRRVEENEVGEEKEGGGRGEG